MNGRKVLSSLAVFLIFSVALVFSSAARAQSVAALYADKCASCHGADGKAATPAGKAVQAHDFHSAEVQSQTDAQLIVTVTKGKGKMPAYEKIYKDNQIKDLVAFCRDLGKKG